MKNITKIAHEIFAEMSQKLSEKEQKVIWDFVDGKKSLYLKIEEIYQKHVNDQIDDIYFNFAKAYVNDDAEAITKYKNMIRKEKTVKHKKDF